MYTSEKVWKLLLDAKKKKKVGDRLFSFFLEGELSVVTAHVKICSQCKVNCVFQSELHY